MDLVMNRVFDARENLAMARAMRHARPGEAIVFAQMAYRGAAQAAHFAISLGRVARPLMVEREALLLAGWNHAMNLRREIQHMEDARQKILAIWPSAAAVEASLRNDRDTPVEIAGHTLWGGEFGEIIFGTNPYGQDFCAGSLNADSVRDLLGDLANGVCFGTVPPGEDPMPALEHLQMEQARLLTGDVDVRFDPEFMGLVEQIDVSWKTATCIGCGCTDGRACWDQYADLPCYWVRIDRQESKGLCSCCAHLMAGWDAGQRDPMWGNKQESDDHGK